jgi:NADH-quinone oxidoreductase subunit L
VSILVGVVGILGALYLYSGRGERSDKLLENPTLKSVHRVLWNKYYVDELYDLIIIRPTMWVAARVVQNFTDTRVIEFIVNGVPAAIGRLSERMRALQTGLLSDYAVAMAIGLFLIIVLLSVR